MLLEILKLQLQNLLTLSLSAKPHKSEFVASRFKTYQRDLLSFHMYNLNNKFILSARCFAARFRLKDVIWLVNVIKSAREFRCLLFDLGKRGTTTSALTNDTFSQSRNYQDLSVLRASSSWLQQWISKRKKKNGWQFRVFRVQQKKKKVKKFITCGRVLSWAIVMFVNVKLFVPTARLIWRPLITRFFMRKAGPLYGNSFFFSTLRISESGKKIPLSRSFKTNVLNWEFSMA